MERLSQSKNPFEYESFNSSQEGGTEKLPNLHKGFSKAVSFLKEKLEQAKSLGNKEEELRLSKELNYAIDQENRFKLARETFKEKADSISEVLFKRGRAQPMSRYEAYFYVGTEGIDLIEVVDDEIFLVKERYHAPYFYYNPKNGEVLRAKDYVERIQDKSGKVKPVSEIRGQERIWDILVYSQDIDSYFVPENAETSNPESKEEG